METLTRTADGGHVLNLTRHFKAPRERVYRAFTEPDHVARWFGPEGMTCEILEFDARPGGRYSLVMRNAEGAPHPLSGTFQELTPPERLVYSWLWGGEGGYAGLETRVTLEFAERDGGTDLTLTHELFTDADQVAAHQGGWTSSFNCLDEALKQGDQDHD